MCTIQKEALIPPPGHRVEVRQGAGVKWRVLHPLYLVSPHSSPGAGREWMTKRILCRDPWIS